MYFKVFLLPKIFINFKIYLKNRVNSVFIILMEILF